MKVESPNPRVNELMDSIKFQRAKLRETEKEMQSLCGHEHTERKVYVTGGKVTCRICGKTAFDDDRYIVAG